LIPKRDLTLHVFGASVMLPGATICEAIEMFYKNNDDAEPNTFVELAITCIFAAGLIGALLLTLSLVR
jgi:hypothetical protein